MSDRNKVLWSEGMFLRPQHFQQQERSLLHHIDQKTTATQAYSWGVMELEIDRDLLAIGKFGLKKATGIFPDGSPFNLPDDSPLPPVIDVESDCRDQIAYLSLPVNRHAERQINDADEELNKTVRYDSQSADVKDVHSPHESESVEVETGVLNCSIRLSSQELEAYTLVPIARILELQSDNMVLLDQQYIASALACSSSSVISDYCLEINGLLQQRGNALASRLSTNSAGGVGEVIDFLFLQVINRNEPLFKHLATLRNLHPLDLYQHMIAVAGELSTIAKHDHRPDEMPPYQHENLASCFAPIMENLRTALNWVPDLRAVSLPLEQHKYGIQTSTVHDKTLLQDAEFVIAVNASIPEEDLRSNFPKQTTIATVETLRDLVMTHTPGISLQAMPVAPRQIPFHSGFSYFKLDKNNKIWKELEQAGSIAIHFSGNYPSLELELWAIRG